MNTQTRCEIFAIDTKDGAIVPIGAYPSIADALKVRIDQPYGFIMTEGIMMPFAYWRIVYENDGATKLTGWYTHLRTYHFVREDVKA